jgi:hypothetical protein
MNPVAMNPADQKGEAQKAVATTKAEATTSSSSSNNCGMRIENCG